MSKIYLSSLVFILSLGSLFGQEESDKYFLDVNHLEELYDNYGLETTDGTPYENDGQTYAVFELTRLHNPFIGDKEFQMFMTLEFDSAKAIFGLDEKLQYILLMKNKDNLNSKFDLYHVVDILDNRFKKHTFSDNRFTWETVYITIYTGIDSAGHLYLYSKPNM